MGAIALVLMDIRSIRNPVCMKKPGFLVVWGRTRLLGQLAQSREKMADELMDEERIAWDAESDRLWKVIPRATPSNLS